MPDSTGRSLSRLEHGLDRAGLFLASWWTWPALMVAMAIAAVTMAMIATPVGEDIHFLGRDLFGTCGQLELTGQPCAGCGMTRSWVQLVRGEVTRAIGYNPAGAALLTGIIAGGMVGAARLIRRQPAFLAMPWSSIGAMAISWLFLLVIGWFIRLAGWIPLPVSG